MANLGKVIGIDAIPEGEEDDEGNKSFYPEDVNFIDDFDKFEKKENLLKEINNNINNNINFPINNNRVIYEGLGSNLGILNDIDKSK